MWVLCSVLFSYVSHVYFCFVFLHVCMNLVCVCVCFFFFFFFLQTLCGCVFVWVMYEYLCLWRKCSFLSGLFVFGCKLLGRVVPLGVNCSFLSSLFVFGCKLLSRVVPLGVNFSFLSGLFEFGCKFLFFSGPPTLGRVLKTRKHPRFSYGTVLVCMIACMYVCYEGRVLKTWKHLSFFYFFLCGFSHFLSEVHQSPFLSTPPYLHVCLHVCVCSV